MDTYFKELIKQLIKIEKETDSNQGVLLCITKELKSRYVYDFIIYDAVNLCKKNHNWTHPKHGHISKWNTSQVTFMCDLFEDYDFNEDISKWDTSNVEYMMCMFRHAKYFNQDISKWNTSKVENMSLMFDKAESFNQDLSKWNTSQVEEMGGMFNDARSFNQDLSKWDTSKVKDMSGMFCGITYFNQDLSKWNTSKVEDMSMMFSFITYFNLFNIFKWNLDSIKHNHICYFYDYNKDKIIKDEFLDYIGFGLELYIWKDYKN